MTDSTSTTTAQTQTSTSSAQPAAAPASSSSSSPLGSIGIGAIISAITGLIGAAAGAGWPGVVALILLGLGIPFGINFGIQKFNDWTDKNDLDRAGSDAGRTAVDLASQGREVSGGLDVAEKLNPPTEGFPKS